MRLFIASDHAGVELKAELVKKLQPNHILVDLGTHTKDSVDYPLFARDLVNALSGQADALGVLICGTGIGMSIAANKFGGIRAACVSEPKSAALAREHNDANVLCLGARIIGLQTALECVDAFVKASFDRSSPRHQRRLDEIRSFEK